MSVNIGVGPNSSVYEDVSLVRPFAFSVSTIAVLGIKHNIIYLVVVIF